MVNFVRGGPPAMRTCTKCGESKPLDQFHKHRMGKDGFSASCGECNRSRVKKYKSENPKTFSEKEVNRTWWRRAFHSARNKARIKCQKKGIPFDLTHGHLVNLYASQGGKCAVSGIEFQKPEGSVSPFSLSIDRISPSLGYVEGNVRLVLMGINSLKLNGTNEDLITICRAVVEKN